MNFTNLLVFDIETIPLMYRYEELSESWKVLWKKKAVYLAEKEEDTPAELWEKKAGIFAEFGKVFCISWGFLDMQEPSSPKLHLKNHYDTDEKALLQTFLEQLLPIWKKYPHIQLAGHNISEFDIPFLCRRMVTHQIGLPYFFPSPTKKPWEFQCFDTLKWWRFGDYKHYTSLDLLAQVFGLASSKHTMDGSMVARYFYEKGDVQNIRSYCNEDVILTSRIILHYLGCSTLTNEQITVL